MNDLTKFENSIEEFVLEMDKETINKKNALIAAIHEDTTVFVYESDEPNIDAFTINLYSDGLWGEEAYLEDRLATLNQLNTVLFNAGRELHITVDYDFNSMEGYSFGLVIKRFEDIDDVVKMIIDMEEVISDNVEYHSEEELEA